MPIGSLLRLSDAEPGSIVYFSGRDEFGFGIVCRWRSGGGSFIARIDSNAVVRSEHEMNLYVIGNAIIDPVITSLSSTRPAPIGSIAIDGDSAFLVCGSSN